MYIKDQLHWRGSKRPGRQKKCPCESVRERPLWHRRRKEDWTQVWDLWIFLLEYHEKVVCVCVWMSVCWGLIFRSSWAPAYIKITAHSLTYLAEIEVAVSCSLPPNRWPLEVWWHHYNEIRSWHDQVTPVCYETTGIPCIYWYSRLPNLCRKIGMQNHVSCVSLPWSPCWVLLTAYVYTRRTGG